MMNKATVTNTLYTCIYVETMAHFWHSLSVLIIVGVVSQDNPHCVDASLLFLFEFCCNPVFQLCSPNPCSAKSFFTLCPYSRCKVNLCLCHSIFFTKSVRSCLVSVVYMHYCLAHGHNFLSDGYNLVSEIHYFMSYRYYSLWHQNNFLWHVVYFVWRIHNWLRQALNC